MNETTQKILKWSQELQAIATAGRFYTKDRFDFDRFERVQELTAEMAALVSEETPETIFNLFEKENIYQTPKIDSRAIIFNERDEILLVEELDHTWAPPGGWCEFDLHPAANAIKEAREEAGVEVDVWRLAAVHDQRIHNEPYKYFTVLRFLYLCRLKGGAFQENIETLRSGWFSLDALPNLHTHKISPAQLRLCLEASKADVWETDFDRA